MCPPDFADDQQAIQQQQALAESCLSLLTDTWQDAVDDGLENPVVILVDCEDDYGGQMARAWLGDEVVSDAIAEVHEDGEEGATTVFARSVTWQQCRDEIVDVFPYLKPAFADSPPTDGFMAVSVTSGGACALSVPRDAIPPNEAN